MYLYHNFIKTVVFLHYCTSQLYFLAVAPCRDNNFVEPYFKPTLGNSRWYCHSKYKAIATCLVTLRQNPKLPFSNQLCTPITTTAQVPRIESHCCFPPLQARERQMSRHIRPAPGDFLSGHANPLAKVFPRLLLLLGARLSPGKSAESLVA
jgi:hypothetical protein